MFTIKFIKVPITDGRNISVNFALVEAIEDNGETIKIALGGKWLELNLTRQEFVDLCNAPLEEEED